MLSKIFCLLWNLSIPSFLIWSAILDKLRYSRISVITPVTPVSSFSRCLSTCQKFKIHHQFFLEILSYRRIQNLVKHLRLGFLRKWFEKSYILDVLLSSEYGSGYCWWKNSAIWLVETGISIKNFKPSPWFEMYYSDSRPLSKLLLIIPDKMYGQKWKKQAKFDKSRKLWYLLFP